MVGAEALLRFPNEAGLVMEGWGSKDALAAFAHLKSLPPAEQNRFMGSWMQGAALSHPEEVLERALEAKTANFDPKSVMRQVIQHSGITGAQAMLQNAIDHVDDDVTTNPAFRSLFDGLTKAHFHHTWTTGQPEQTANWVEKIKDEPYLKGEHVRTAAYNYLAKGNPQEAVAWAKRMATSGKTDAVSGLQGAAQAFPKKFEQLPAEVQAAVMAGKLP